MTPNLAWPALLRGLIAILRRVRPDEAVAIVEELVVEGSSAPKFRSIRRCRSSRSAWSRGPSATVA